MYFIHKSYLLHKATPAFNFLLISSWAARRPGATYSFIIFSYIPGLFLSALHWALPCLHASSFSFSLSLRWYGLKCTRW